MQRHWQKKPLLVRRALPDFSRTLEPFSPGDVLRLARNGDAESRLVTRDRGKWALQHGPFKPATLRGLGARNWTLLVQDTQHFSQRSEALLAQFAFIPHVRIDDLMVSLAAPGGGVGPHVDSYDVFLIQGHGRRRWRISGQSDTAFRPGLPLKILKNFRPEQEWVLESGDMLYLPPGYAHEGVAVDECLTYSVGFRSPTHQEWIESFLDQRRDQLCVEGQYADAGLKPTSHPGEIPSSVIRGLDAALRAARWTNEEVAEAAGRFLTEPKSHVVFGPPEIPLSLAEFCRGCAARGLRLDGRTRMAYSGDRVFINGESTPFDSARNRLLKQLADSRTLPPCKPSRAESALLHGWHENGYLHVHNP
jgi:50S ribosomal protein L16 3-hydroxylase